MTQHASCCAPLPVPMPFSRRTLDAPTPFTRIRCCCSRQRAYFPAASAHPAAAWLRLACGASGPRRMKRRVTRITKTRTRTNLLSRYADAPTPNATRVALTRRAFGDMSQLRYAFCAPRFYSKLPMLCEVQRIRDATLCFACACETRSVHRACMQNFRCFALSEHIP